jgi:hypothetical protein
MHSQAGAWEREEDVTSIRYIDEMRSTGRGGPERPPAIRAHTRHAGDCLKSPRLTQDVPRFFLGRLVEQPAGAVLPPFY